MRQCNLYSTPQQYHKSNEFITAWIGSPENKEIIGDELCHAIEQFQANLMCKEAYLAQYRRKNITMCADAMTTSPVESMNDLLKRKQKITSNYNMSKSIEHIVVNNNLRYGDRVNESFMQMNRTVLSSKSPTKDDVHQRCTNMMDYFHDKCHKLKCVQLSEFQWQCWSFTDPETRTKYYPSWNVEDDNYEIGLNESNVGNDDYCIEERESYDVSKFIKSLKPPHFLNLYDISVHRFDGKMFMKCSCCFYERLVRYVLITNCTDAKYNSIANTPSPNSHIICEKIWISM